MAAPEPPISPLARAVFGRMAEIIKVAIPEPDLATDLECDPAELDAAIDELVALDLVVRWVATPDAPTCHGYSGPIVTMSALMAARVGKRLNPRSTRWVPHGGRERSARLEPEPTGGYAVVVSEVDLAVDPPGNLDDLADPDARDPAEAAGESLDSVLRAERAGGYIRPAYLLGTEPPWPVAGQDRGPWAPDPGNPPEGRPIRAVPRCPGCGGVARPGGLCLACDLYYADDRLPRAERDLVARSPRDAIAADRDRTRSDRPARPPRPGRRPGRARKVGA